MKKNIVKGKSSGAASGILLILGIVLLVIIVVVFLVIRSTAAKKNTTPANTTTTQSDTVTQPPEPVTEATLGDIRFVFESAVDLGMVIKSPNTAFQQNLTTTEKFIKVTIGAQNKGKLNVSRDVWNVGNIVDSDGRNFVSINDQAYYFLPNPTLCGTLLKPEFEPIPCIKLYEVSKESKNLKVEVNTISSSSSKKQEAFIDLNVK